MSQIENWYKHWNNHYRYDQSYGSCLTDAKYLVKNAEGKISLLETVYVFYDKSGDTGKNIVGCRFVGGKDEFEYTEEEIHKRIIGWK